MSAELRLPRSRRLTRRADFGATMKSDLRSRDDCFSVYAVIDDVAHARLGVTVGRRVSLKAVARNRIKRQIRESFRQHQHSLTGIRLVVNAHPQANGKNNAQLRTSLDKHWQRVTHLCKKSRTG